MGPLNIKVTSDILFYIYFIVFQFLIVIAIGLSIRFARYIRNRNLLLQEEMTKTWAGIITEKVLNPNASTKIQMPQSPYKVELLQEVLIDMMKSLSGPSFQAVADIYKEIGFLNKDHSVLKKWRKFDKKLLALSRINILQDNSSVSFVRPYQYHQNYYLRFSALRFLIRRDPQHIQNLDKEMLILIKKRRFDTILEIATVMAVYQKTHFLSYFENLKNLELKRIFLKVVATLKIVEALPTVRNSLKENLSIKNQDLPLIKQHMLCLTVTYEAESEDLLHELSSHPNTEIRYLALCTLFIIRPDLKDSILSSITTQEKSGLEQAFQNFTVTMGRVSYG